jgi:hypothetical protein
MVRFEDGRALEVDRQFAPRGENLLLAVSEWLFGQRIPRTILEVLDLRSSDAIALQVFHIY